MKGLPKQVSDPQTSLPKDAILEKLHVNRIPNVSQMKAKEGSSVGVGSRDAVEAIYCGLFDPSSYADIVDHLEESVLMRLADLPPPQVLCHPDTQSIVAHLDRAEKLLDMLRETWERNLGHDLEAQPYAAMAITDSGRIVAANRAAEHAVEEAETVFDLPILAGAEKKISKFLSLCAKSSGNADQIDPIIVQIGTSNGQGVMLLERMKVEWSAFVDVDHQRLANGHPIFVRSADFSIGSKTWDLLKSGFDLTDTEVEVVRSLVAGMSAPAIAGERNRSTETVRSQLKSIFQKTGAKNQIALVRVVTTVALLAPRTGKSAQGGRQSSAMIRRGVHVLKDGRQQFYVECGKRNGRPVLCIQPNSRPDFTSDVVRALADAGLRVVSPIRPGTWGMATAPASAVPNQIVDDYADLARAIGLEGGVLAGFRTGGPYAYCLADRHPRLFDRLVLAETGAPLESISRIRAMPDWPRKMFWAARTVPRLLVYNFRLGTVDFHRGPEKQRAAVQYYFRGNRSDEEFLKDPCNFEYARRHIAYSLEDPDQLCRDIALWAQDWSAVAKRVADHISIRYLHGSENSWFPVTDVLEFAARTSGVAATILEGEGQLAIYNQPERFAEVLSSPA